MRHHTARVGNAGLVNAGPLCRGGVENTRLENVATSVSVSRALTKCSVRDVVVQSAMLELT